MLWRQREERVRLAIIKDLIAADLLRCKTINLDVRQRTLPLRAMPTQPLSARTVTMETEVRT